ncbi:helix-turn-helix transcriptional regulator [Nocardia takedensis]|uniref:helix-turn-helix transcriptional regulator n=1 Tax=Nocardia takedensis TaxID=259390 RepID=UPI000A048C41|nr:helix-turn-helix domain-containing protein [Nocardia takedensis]
MPTSFCVYATIVCIRNCVYGLAYTHEAHEEGTALASTQQGSARSNLIRLKEAGELVGMHPTTIRRWINRGLLQAVKIGPRVIKVERDDVLAVLRPLENGSAK